MAGRMYSRSTYFHRTGTIAFLAAAMLCGLCPVATPTALAQAHFGPAKRQPEKHSVRLYIEPTIYGTGSSSTDEQDMKINEYTTVTAHNTETDFSMMGLGVQPLAIAMGADFFVTPMFFLGPHISYGSTDRESTDHSSNDRDVAEGKSYNLMVQGGALFNLGDGIVKGSLRGGVGYYGNTDTRQIFDSGSLELDDVYEESALSWSVAAIVHFMLARKASLDLGVRYLNVGAHDIEANWKEDDTKFSHETNSSTLFSLLLGLSLYL
jgi:opacity protein-like surface antigen